MTMTTRIRVGVTSIVSIVALSVVMTGQRQGGGRAGAQRRIAEPRDLAQRRAQAFHDMYAAPPDKAVLAERISLVSRERAGAAKAARVLPINYGSFDPEFRL